MITPDLLSTDESRTLERARLQLEIHGAVQGVGFRPFVYRLATGLGLAGWVVNNSQGVFLEVEGPKPAVAEFPARLLAEMPPRAIVQTLDSSWLEPAGYDRFEIRHSGDHGAKTALILPDVATCEDCLAEVLDPGDRRYRYPFTNCTNCGPRFTIVEALPYDRPNTTMRRFALCPACAGEYENPRDRRFHAQPNACPVCGPHLELWDQSGAALAEGDEALKRTATALQAGAIIAVKGLGGFHLMVDARNVEAVARLRAGKPRRDKPFALMARDLEQAQSLCEVPPPAEVLLTAPEAPIVLLRRRVDASVAENVAPGNPNLGVMLPYTPLHHLLLRELDGPVVATSGNLSDEPICTEEEEAVRRLGHIADRFLVHNRPIARHADDSVAWVLLERPRLLRRARGYAPLPVLLPNESPTLLAVGAHQKNTVALSVGRQVFISQHIGDLETPEALTAFERTIADFLRLYEASPVAVAHDLHPDYLSTRWAQAEGERMLIPVQHHHAHLAACLADNGVQGKALGVTWDGTGYGLDGTIWGGEFLLGDAADFTRFAALRPFRLPGGETAVKEPGRAALALLWELYGEAAFERDDLAPVRAFRPAERRLLAQMLSRGVNALVTSSAGRLFDGIAALIGLHQRVSFEGQAAMALEYAAKPGVEDMYPMNLAGFPIVLDWQPVVEAVLDDLRRGVAPGIIAARFHNTLAEAIVEVARRAREKRVALTGGCFQNRYLTERATRRLTEAGFEVLLHRQVPPNDGGISLGQVAVAAARLRRGSA